MAIRCMKMMKYWNNYIYILIALVEIFVSCSFEEDLPPPDNETVDVTLSIQMSDMPASTRAMTADMEVFVEAIDILAFKTTDDDPPTSYLVYHTQAKRIYDTENNICRFIAALKEDNDPQHFVIVVNAAEAVEHASPQESEEKEALLHRIVFTNPEGKWNSTDENNFTPLPMSGESGEVIINENTFRLETIPVSRSLVRLDVEVATNEAKDIFKLTSIHLYNGKANGCVVPNKDSWEAGVDGNPGRYTTPTLPANLQNFPGPVRYDAVSSTSCSNVIYTPEAAGGELRAINATCIVIGGEYDGNEETFYRVDYLNKDDPNYMPLIRNHFYRTNITKVLGEGYSSVDEAFRSRPVNMEIEVIEWNQGELNNIVADGSYMLGISQNLFVIPQNNNGNLTLSVYTDHPDGWKAEVDRETYPAIELKDGNPELDEVTGLAFLPGKIRFSVADNSAGEDRELEFIVSAWRLKFVVTIQQSTIGNIFLSITDANDNETDEFSFYTNEQVPQTMTVKWGSVFDRCDVYKTSITPGYAHPFEFEAGSDDPGSQQSYTGGETTFSITSGNVTPPAEEPFYEGSTSYNFIVTDGKTILSKNVRLKQVKPHIRATEVIDAYHPGGSYTIKVEANAEWTVSLLNNGHQNAIETYSLEPGRYNLPDGTLFAFTVNSDEANVGKTPVFVFTNTKDPANPVEVPVAITSYNPTTYNVDNCLMVKPGDYAYIPVKRAYDAWSGILDLNNYNIEEVVFLWTDNISLNPQIIEDIDFTTAERGRNAVVRVKTGGAEGNMVLGVIIQGEIRWSWHLWITNYDPEELGGTFRRDPFISMNRNLGAMSTRLGDLKTHGCYYQWGRKDPFPKAIGISDNTTHCPIYRVSYEGVVKQAVIEKKPVSEDKNLWNSIMNPMTFYYSSTSSWGDWYTNFTQYGIETHINRYLWSSESDGSKTIYDPCPYGWRVPPQLNTSPKNPWDGIDTQGNFNKGSGLNITGPQAVGAFQATGCMTTENGKLSGVGERGYLWTATANPQYLIEYSWALYFSRGSYTTAIWTPSWNPTAGSSRPKRASGYQVRCVKDVPELNQ